MVIKTEINEKITTVCTVPFSIGDIIKLKRYGCMYSVQEYAYRSSSLPKDREKNFFNPYQAIPLETEWKIIDVGVFLNCQHDLIVNLINRNKEEILIQYCINGYSACLYEDPIIVIRKAKKQLKEFLIKV
jgi:hypothetical protein